MYFYFLMSHVCFNSWWKFFSFLIIDALFKHISYFYHFQLRASISLSSSFIILVLLPHVSFLVSFIGLCNFHFVCKFLVFVLFNYVKRLEQFFYLLYIVYINCVLLYYIRFIDIGTTVGYQCLKCIFIKKQIIILMIYRLRNKCKFKTLLIRCSKSKFKLPVIT